MSCYNTGRRFFSKNFILFVREREEGPKPWRMGLAVTKKTGNAVQRNRVKRVLRELFRLHQYDVPDTVDIVVVPKRRLDPERVSLELVSQELLPLIHTVRESLTPQADTEAP